MAIGGKNPHRGWVWGCVNRRGEIKVETARLAIGVSEEI